MERWKIEKKRTKAEKMSIEKKINKKKWSLKKKEIKL